MSRSSRLEQTTLADEVEWVRSQQVAVIEEQPEGRARNFMEGLGIGLIIQTVFRGIF